MRPVVKPLPPSIAVDELLDAPTSRKVPPLTLRRLQLQATIGDYCSFCELPINVTRSLTSKYVRKLKRVPTLSQWDELLLACDFCQFHRTRDVTSLSDYLWPDTDATFSLNGTSPFLYALKDVTYIVKSETLGTDRDSSVVPMVIVSANPQSSVYAKAVQTIGLFQLNSPFYDASANTYTMTQSQLESRADPRVQLRTRAWSSAMETVDTLRQMKAMNAYPLVFETTVKASAAVAQACGFWSVWMTALWQAFSDPTLLHNALLEVRSRAGYQITGFQTFPDGGQPPWTVFTGTAVDRIAF